MEELIFKAFVLCLVCSVINIVIQIVLILNDFFWWFDDETLWRGAIWIWSISSNLLLGSGVCMLLKVIRTL